MSELPIVNQICIGLAQDTAGRRSVRLYGGGLTQPASDARSLDDLVSQEIPVGSASKKRPIKFATGSPQLRSGVWRVWSPKETGDVYVMPLSTESFAKISLHETGDWRLQILSEQSDHPQLHFVSRPDSTSRILDQWQRPPEFVDGWTDAMTVLIPNEDVTAVPLDTVRPTDVPRWMSRPPSRHCSRYRIFLVKDDAATLCVDWSDNWSRYRLTLIGAYPDFYHREGLGWTLSL
ncbi:hypothetical protein VZC37_20715 [Gordonia sp. LSe1-13]|uniref:Uncharacterized protein n=1 Tax=Gordonia sesuvii TaxID=3116777 RepID=A0ABU7MI44_9ACTN|nr:hypothetical protein [Gordonia sp. LSe1-13]